MAMSTLTPPVQLACPDNRHRIEYILNLVKKDFEFPSVSVATSDTHSSFPYFAFTTFSG